MAERYRDDRGRWVSPSALPNLANYFRETYEKGREVQRERVERAPEPLPEPPAYAPSNWHDDEWKGGGVVRTADGSPMSDDAFEDIPDDAESFQVRFIMPDNPDYPRGWASYTTMDAGEWERIDDILQDGRDRGAIGVGAIIFHVYS